MKVAALISGQMRTLDRCVDNLRWALGDDVDYYVHAVAGDDAEMAYLLKPRVLVVEPDVAMPERYEYVLQTRGYTNAIQSCLRQMYFLRRMWRTYELTGDDHDWVVRIRPDSIFLNKIEDLRTLEPAIYVPMHDNWRGLNDRLAFGPRALMKRYFTRLDLLDEYIDGGGVFHMETFLAWVFRDDDVRRTGAWSVTLRPNLEHVGPYKADRWGDPPGEIPREVRDQVYVFE